MKNRILLKIIPLGILLVFMGFGSLKAATYTFSTAGNWSNASNWAGGVLPPNPLPIGDEIVINANCTHNWYLTINGTIIVNASLSSYHNRSVCFCGDSSYFRT